jgi:hypothetical protein
MNNQIAIGRPSPAATIAAIILFAVCTTNCSRGNLKEEAKSILKESGVQGGLVVYINCGHGTMTRQPA